MVQESNPPLIVYSEATDGSRVNRPFTERLGFTNEQFCAQPFLDWIHPVDRPNVERSLHAGEGKAYGRIQSTQGEWVPFEFQVKAHGDSRAVLGQLRSDANLKVEPVATGPLPARTGLQNTLDAMARIVEAKNRDMRCSILLVDPDTQRVVVGAGPSLPSEYNAAVEGLCIGPMVGSCGTASFWNVPVIVENISEDPLWSELREVAALAGVAACWSHPITATNGGVLGAMALYGAEPCAPARHQMDGLEIAARMVGLAVERERLEAQLRQASKLEAIGVLAGGIAHDFNNMMVTVLGNAELGLATLPDQAKAKPMLNDIITATLSASDLCDQMLGFAGKRASATEPLECNALVRELGGLSQVALSKKAELTYDLAGEPLGILGDRSQLGQVIMNLTTNASDAIGDNQGHIVVGTRAERMSRDDLARYDSHAELAPGDYVRLWISDTGEGMSQETQARIFDPFFTTKPDGRGLGLAAVRGIVRGHKGTLTLISEEGVGTTVSVLLPRVPLSSPRPSPPEVYDGSSGARVLIIDDEAMVRKTLKQSLEHAGHSVVLASDGEEGVNVFRREADSIDCVLLDLSMPKLGGEEVFRELVKIRKDAKVILCSGYAEQEVIDRFQGADLAGVLKKPARRHVVLQKVSEALGRGRLQILETPQSPLRNADTGRSDRL